MAAVEGRVWPTPLSKLHPTLAINNFLTLNSLYTVDMLSTPRTPTLWNIPLYIQRFRCLEEEGTYCQWQFLLHLLHLDRGVFEVFTSA